jgi:molybdate transport repressor ModE-like protein
LQLLSISAAYRLTAMTEIKHFRLLRALNTHGSMSAAARELGYSQPAVTQQLQSWERSLGTPLVIRGGGRLRLTPAGRLLHDHGERVLDIVDRAEVEVDSLRTLNAGTVRIASFPSASATIVPEAMARLRTRHPNLTFTLIEGTPTESLELLRSGRCDVAVVFQYSSQDALPREDLEWRPLMREDVHLAFPPDYGDPALQAVPIADLWDAAWIAGCPNCSGNIIDTCREAGFEPRIEFETDDYVAVQSLAINGLGVSLIPDLILSIVSLPRLRLVRPEPAQFRSVSAVSTPGLMMTPGVAETMTVLEAVARDLADQGRDGDLRMRAPRRS